MKQIEKSEKEKLLQNLEKIVSDLTNEECEEIINFVSTLQSQRNQ